MRLTDRYKVELLELVDRYKAVSGKADSSVSSGAFPSDGGFVSRLRKGKNVMLYKAARLEDYIEHEIEEIRRKVGSRPSGEQVPVSLHPIHEETGEPASPSGSEAGRALSDGDGTEDWPRRV